MLGFMFKNLTFSGLESNIWKYTIFSICDKRVFISILGAFYLTIDGVSAATIGYITAISTVVSFLLGIPGGYIADKLGHKIALILSRVIMLSSSICFLFADSLFTVIVASALFGVAFAFTRGVGSAFMHETLRGLDKDSEYTHIMGRVSSIGFAVPAVIAILVPLTVIYGERMPFVIALCLDSIALIVSLCLVHPHVKEEHVDVFEKLTLNKMWKEGIKLDFFRLMLISPIITGAMIGFTHYRAAYQSLLEIPVEYYGIFFGIGRLLAATISAYNGKLKTYFTLKSFYLFQILTFSGLFAILAMTSNPAIVVTTFIVMNVLLWGLNQIPNGFMLEIIGKSRYKATLLSVRSQVDYVATFVTGLAFGVMLEDYGYQDVFAYFTVGFFTLLIFIYLWSMRIVKG